MTKRVNIGCGSRFRDGWDNFDLVANSSQVQPIDVTQRLPIEDRSYDFAYTSHMLEHLTLAQGRFFLCEAFRILRPQGVLRVVVPDLEQACRRYLASVNAEEDCSPTVHRWNIIRIIDQCARETSGGMMRSLLQEMSESDYKYLEPSLGPELRRIRSSGGNPGLLRRMKRKLVSFLSHSSTLLQVYQVGRFRLSGQCHKHMYDRRELSTVLQDAGFVEISQFDYKSSTDPRWSEFELDSEDGKEYKPLSLYMEAKRPVKRVGT